MEILAQSLFIFALRVVGIAVSTISTILTVQGRKLPAIATGSVSVLIYVVAIGQVVTNLGNAWYVAAYVLGFAVGTWVGMALEQRLALGYAAVRVISTERGEAIAAALRRAGFGATELYGRGQESPVVVIEAIVPRKNVPTLIHLAEQVDQQAIVAVSEARSVQRGYWRPERKR